MTPDDACCAVCAEATVGEAGNACPTCVSVIQERLMAIEKKLDLLLQARPGKRLYLYDKTIGIEQAAWGPMSLGETVFACVPDTIDEP